MNTFSTKNILLVEDEIITATVETRQLQNEGYAVRHVLNGEDAIDCVNNADEKIDLILMDIDLGNGIDGPEAARIILQNHDIPVVFLSAHTEKEIVDKTEKITSYGYIVKNSGEMVLIASVKMALKLFESNLKIKESKKYIEAIIESTTDFIWSVDPVDFGLITFNQGLFQYFLKQKKITIQPGMRPIDLLPTAESARMWEDFYRETIKNGTFCTEYTTSSGTNILELTINIITIGNSIQGLSIFGKDITEKKLLFSQLKNSEEKFYKIFQASSNAVVITKFSEGTLVDVNKSFEKIFGYAKEEVVGKTIFELKLWKDFSEREKLLDIYQRDKYLEKVKAEFLSKSGEMIYGIVTFALIDLNDETYTLSIVTDITEHKQAWLEWNK